VTAIPPMQYSDSRKRRAVDWKDSASALGGEGERSPTGHGAGAHHYGRHRADRETAWPREIFLAVCFNGRKTDNERTYTHTII